RMAGVQHPAPMVTCVVGRDQTGIRVSAPFANPVYDGRSLRPFPPRTEIWVLLYTQVAQADAAERRNVLLSHKPARFERPPLSEVGGGGPEGSHGTATWANDEVYSLLEILTLGPDAPLSCLAVETLPGESPLPDPLGSDLGHQRILRTSPLVPIPPLC